ncbi:hypothetical protein B0H14DRAFT_2645849 [Mycena olivaceomarginata]|nr:hypothetical protein B0H14DRAFT_2645849 [Mycena olivaceomarginata]
MAAAHEAPNLHVIVLLPYCRLLTRASDEVALQTVPHLGCDELASQADHLTNIHIRRSDELCAICVDKKIDKQDVTLSHVQRANDETERIDIKMSAAELTDALGSERFLLTRKGAGAPSLSEIIKLSTEAREGIKQDEEWLRDVKKGLKKAHRVLDEETDPYVGNMTFRVCFWGSPKVFGPGPHRRLPIGRNRLLPVTQRRKPGGGYGSNGHGHRPPVALPSSR